VFQPTEIKVDGRYLRGLALTCCKCGAVGSVRMNHWKSSSGKEADKREWQIATRKFEDLGWSVNGNRSFCPDCTQPKKANGAMATVTNLQPTPPRVQTREDRRIIYEKLRDIYDDAKGCYSEKWTDKLVAKDLNVPQAWVAEERDRSFGPGAGNSEIDEVLEQTNKLIAEARKAAQTIIGKADDLERRLIDIQKAVRP
jgi:hypothetical protein